VPPPPGHRFAARQAPELPPVLCRVRAFGIASALLVCALLPIQGSAGARWRALAALERSGAQVSASAIDLQSGRLIEQLNGQTRLTPASLTKLTTAAVALATWPADRMFQTRLMSAATVRNGILEGDLILQGAGDPSLDDHSLWTLAAQLRGTGVTAVRGRLLVEPAPFGIVACETADRCNAQIRSDNAYNAPLAAVGVDFGTWCVRVRATLPGTPALVRGCGVSDLPVPIEGLIRTVANGSRQTFWIERVTIAQGDRLRIGGDIPAGEQQEVYRAMSDPARGVGLLLKETLREIGIGIEGPVLVGAQDLAADAQVLAEVEGLTLREQLGRMLRFSNNYIADVLTLDLAAGALQSSPMTLAGAGQLLSDFVARMQPPHAGAAPGPLLLSGSGLTDENRLSANDLVGLLAHEYRDTRHFPAFYGALVVPRDAPFAFLRGGSSAWLDRVALKTGTMEEPLSVCGIAGYLRKRDGGWIAFAAIVNGSPRKPHVPHTTALQAEHADLDALLQEY